LTDLASAIASLSKSLFVAIFSLNLFVGNTLNMRRILET
jgi:hypothetical protein